MLFQSFRNDILYAQFRGGGWVPAGPTVFKTDGGHYVSAVGSIPTHPRHVLKEEKSLLLYFTGTVEKYSPMAALINLCP